MSDVVVRVLAGAVLVLLFGAAWVAGVFYVARDAATRGLPFWLRALWVLAALVPMLGLTAYVVYYARLFVPRVPALTGTQPRQRITLPRPAVDAPHTGTMPVAALRH